MKLKQLSDRSINFEDYLYFCETSESRLRWKVDVRSGRNYSLVKYKAGDSAGYVSQGYRKVQICGNNYLAHRILYYFYYGSFPDFVDHIDQNSMNNSKENLRAVTKAVNCRNQAKHSNNISGVTGVYRTTRKGGGHIVWTAEWRTLDKKKCTKSFSVRKYGEEESFRLACEYRVKMIAEMNNQGAMYSEHHGKEFSKII